MSIYREILTGLKTLLESVDDKYGLVKVAKAIDDWDKTKNYRGLSSYFHKEGLNDLIICSENGHKIANGYETIVNKLFQYYLELYFHYDPIKDELNPIVFQDSKRNPMISSWRCFNCGYAIWTKGAIENYVYNRFLGKTCKNYIDNNRFTEFSDYKKLHKDFFMNFVFEEIVKILSAYRIEYKTDFKYFQNCSKCDTYDNGVYRWDLIYNDAKIEIIERDDNLKIKK